MASEFQQRTKQWRRLKTRRLMQAESHCGVPNGRNRQSIRAALRQAAPLRGCRADCAALSRAALSNPAFGSDAVPARTCGPVGRRGGIVIVALRRIEPGEEITYDYWREYLKYFLENGGCRCAACCRKRTLRRRRARRRRKRTR